MNWTAVPFAAALYVVGVAVHELTHIAACVLTVTPIDRVRAYPPQVRYDPATRRVDHAVKVAPVGVFAVAFVAYAAWLLDDPFSARAWGLVFFAGYAPRSRTDWLPVRAFFTRVFN